MKGHLCFEIPRVSVFTTYNYIQKEAKRQDLIPGESSAGDRENSGKIPRYSGKYEKFSFLHPATCIFHNFFFFYGIF